MDYAASVTLKWLVHRKSLLHSQHIKLVNAPDASSDAKSDISDRHVLPFSDRKLLTLPYLHALSSWLVSDLPSLIMYRSGVRPSVPSFPNVMQFDTTHTQSGSPEGSMRLVATRGMRVDTNLFSSWAGVTRELLASSSTPRDVKHAPYSVR